MSDNLAKPFSYEEALSAKAELEKAGHSVEGPKWERSQWLLYDTDLDGKVYRIRLPAQMPAYLSPIKSP